MPTICDDVETLSWQYLLFPPESTDKFNFPLGILVKIEHKLGLIISCLKFCDAFSFLYFNTSYCQYWLKGWIDTAKVCVHKDDNTKISSFLFTKSVIDITAPVLRNQGFKIKTTTTEIDQHHTWGISKSFSESVFLQVNRHTTFQQLPKSVLQAADLLTCAQLLYDMSLMLVCCSLLTAVTSATVETS